MRCKVSLRASGMLSTGLDLRTAVISIILAPIIYFVLRRTGQFSLRLVRYLIDWALRVIGRNVMHSLAGRISMRDYCKYAIRGPSQWLTVPGLRDVKLKTDEVFVPLLLTGTLRAQGSYSSESVLDAGNRILIVGDPGSGKSSLVKRVYRECAFQALKRPTRSRLPILIPLPRLLDTKVPFDGSLQWASGRLEEELRKSPSYEPKELLETCLQVTGIVLLLDGLDEVSSDSYRRCLEAIHSLSEFLDAKGEKNSIVITMRSSYYHQVASDLTETFPEVLYVRPLTSGDVFEFLLKWPFGDSREVYRNAVRVHRELTDRPTLREMCSNPLILAMYVSHGELTGTEAGIGPETRTQFYERVVEELLVLRRGRQGTSVVARTALREQRESLLGSLALSHLLDEAQSANSLSWTEAVITTQEKLHCEQEEAIDSLNLLMKETGLFEVERESQSIRFIHLTFCEFLAAVEATRGRVNGLGTVIDRCEYFAKRPEREVRSRLLEVVPFAIGLTPRVSRLDALGIILNRFSWQLIARCLLETQAYANTEWQSKLEAELDELASTPEDQWGAEWFARLRLASVVVEDATRVAVVQNFGNPPVSLEQFYNELVRGQRSRLITMFSSIARQEPSSAFRLAAQAGVDLLQESPEVLISSMSEPVFASMVYDYISSNPTNTAAWATMLAEAALRYKSVSADLSRLSSFNAEWTRCYSSIRPPDRWGDFPSASHLVREAVSIGIAQLETDNSARLEDVYKCLVRLRELPNWRQLKYYRIFARVAAILIVVVDLALAPHHLLKGAVSLPELLITIGWLYAALLPAFLLYCYAYAHKLIYLSLFNIVANPFKTDVREVLKDVKRTEDSIAPEILMSAALFVTAGISLFRLTIRRKHQLTLAELDEIRATG
jgi:NACHT domain-containing protein